MKTCNGFANLSRTCKPPSRQIPENIAALEEELDRAHVVDAKNIPRDVITLNSQVRIMDLDNGRVFEYEVVYPNTRTHSSADPLSVLAPLGYGIARLSRRRHDQLVRASRQATVEGAGDYLSAGGEKHVCCLFRPKKEPPDNAAAPYGCANQASFRVRPNGFDRRTDGSPKRLRNPIFHAAGRATQRSRWCGAFLENTEIADTAHTNRYLAELIDALAWTIEIHQIHGDGLNSILEYVQGVLQPPLYKLTKFISGFNRTCSNRQFHDFQSSDELMASDDGASSWHVNNRARFVDHRSHRTSARRLPL